MDLSARPVNWRIEHDDRLRISAGEDLADIRREVEQGVSVLWECQSEGQPQAYVVTRLEGLEWVIVLGEGRGFFDFMPLFVRHARGRGWRLRTHVQRRGLVRMWNRLGLTLDHYVLKG